MGIKLLVSVLALSVLVSGQLEWRKKCNKYRRDRTRTPAADAVEVAYGVDKAACRATCTGRRDCGGFVALVSARAGAHDCLLYNVNDRVIHDYLGTNWYTTALGHRTATWYSKDCNRYAISEEAAEAARGCSYFKTAGANSYISGAEWQLPGGTSLGVSGLTAGQCQAWCSLYARCRSVAFVEHSDEARSQCQMYTTTIGDLIREGRDGDVAHYQPNDTTGPELRAVTTYDRVCDE